MADKASDTTIDLADRVANLETALSSFATDHDAFSARLETLENTVKAIGDGVATLSPEAAVSAAADIADIKEKANAFYARVFGDVLFLPAAVSPPE